MYIEYIDEVQYTKSSLPQKVNFSYIFVDIKSMIKYYY